jgi:predicted dehydrogenase
MAKKLKLGIIGMGSIGNVHAQAFTAAGETDLLAVCDTLPARLEAASAKHHVPQTFDDYHDLLDTDVESVVVAVPNAMHHPIAVAALRAGKNVLLEKPMALNARLGAEIVAEARKAKRTLQIGMVWRQDATARQVREMARKGTFGKIYHIRAVMTRRRGIPGMGGWFTTKSISGGGPMIDLGVHWFDICMFMSGLWSPTSVSAKTYDVFGPRMKKYAYVEMWAGPPKFDGVFDVEDYSTGFIRYGKDATLSFEISWAGNSQSQTWVEILGTEAGAKILDGNEKSLVLLTEHNGKVADLTVHLPPNPPGFESQARAFVAACRGERPPAATGEEGVIVMKVLDAIYASSKANKEVPVR